VEDRTAEGGWTAGGPSLYSARTAAALGATVTLVTCELVSAGRASFDRSVLEGLEVVELPRVQGRPMPRYANAYDAQGNRTQLLVEQGDDLLAGSPGTEQLSRIRDSVEVLILAPAFHELAHPPVPAIPAALRAISLQGLLRDVSPEMEVFARSEPWRHVAEWVECVEFAFFSEEDTADPEALARRLATAGLRVFLTRGYRGAVLFTPEGGREYAPIPAESIDPTGAGDCFATAFVVRFAETGDIETAAQFALAAGAVSVERPGLAGVPSRVEIEARLREAAA
jgi:sugar/nucleoside kinase (ribokinase family)